MQEQLLEEELQMSGAPLGVVFLSQAGQPEAEGLEGDAADLLAAVIQPLQQVCSDKSGKTAKKRLRGAAREGATKLKSIEGFVCGSYVGRSC